MPTTAEFAFAHHLPFSPGNAEALLRDIPAAQGIFALRGEDPAAEPYLTRAADLRRRLRRLLAPPETDASGQPVLSRRLNLRNRVHFIDYTLTGSDFESTLLLYKASRAAFGAEEARRRLRLYPPYFLRITMSHEHPRVYSTNRLSKKSLPESFGPFPSRAAAERYCDAVLDLFQLRRCYEDLEPHPEHPGCVYGEMNKCLRPCQQACTPAQYAQEADRVHAFFTTRGQSLLDEVAAQREAASEAMDFELAATLHKHWEKVRAASFLADELVRPVPDLRAVILQQAAPITTLSSPSEERSNFQPSSSRPESALFADGAEISASPGLAAGFSPLNETTETSGFSPGQIPSQTADAAIFLLEHGHLAGPERLSTLGVRAVREQTAVGSSLFAQPLMLAPVPLDEPGGAVASPGLAAGFSPGSAASKEEGFSPGPATQDVISTAAQPNLHSVISTAAQPNLHSVISTAAQPNPHPVISTPAQPNLHSVISTEGAPLRRSGETPVSSPAPSTTLNPEDRARATLNHLSTQTETTPERNFDIADLCDALSLLRRWYYRPEKQRHGEVFLPNPDHSWPIRRILNGAARVVLGPPTAAPPVDRAAAKEGAKTLKTKIIHAGREGVEREVPVLPKRPRTRKAITPSDLSS